MSIALLGLVGLQFYWVNMAMSVQKERFRQEVHSLLNTVVNKLEQHEALYIIKKQVENSVKVTDDFFFVDYDSSGVARWNEQQTIKIKQWVGSDKLREEGYAYEVEEKAVISKSGIARKNKIADFGKLEQQMFQSIPDIEPIGDSLIWQRLSSSISSKLAQRSNMVSFIMDELLLMDKKVKIEDRVSEGLLDSLLHTEMQNRGLHTDYNFGVLNPKVSSKKMVICSNPESERNILTSEFQTKLFPSDLFGGHNILYVNFPNQEAYLIRQNWLVLSSSIFFLIIISVCFSIAIQTILKQKKLSEITNDFISNMTHELKTPISTVSLACEALMDPDIRKIPSLGTRYLSVIKDENNRLAEQVERVLQIARLDKGDFKLKITKIDLHEVICKAITNIKIQIENREGTIGTSLKAENTMIEADEVHLSNIIYNLLDNANKYSPEQPNIQIATSSMNGGIVLEVTDQGQGISNENINKVFDKFYRVPTGNVHNVKGFGLGLSYVRKMVEAHRGTISVKSELNQGSTFTIYLPYRHEQN
ncbi:HAMP domain-containing sensor histidine kinase [Rapidithrix thailandica]|uniref:histidine kinase n=1 Tax=Rapidithrix thailandica TaxID=413964 RepID=A0AAW9RUC3_9BACT